MQILKNTTQPFWDLFVNSFALLKKTIKREFIFFFSASFCCFIAMLIIQIIPALIFRDNTLLLNIIHILVSLIGFIALLLIANITIANTPK